MPNKPELLGNIANQMNAPVAEVTATDLIDAAFLNMLQH